MDLPLLRYLDRASVEASMPPVEERLRLADLTMRALASGAGQLPPKIGISPGPADSFAHAMPAHLRGAQVADDLVGIKWVLGFPTNNAIGVTAIHAIAILNDPATGIPIGILDAWPITAHRTAAVSGVAIRAWGPQGLGRPARAAIIGAGTQGMAHLPVLGHVLPKDAAAKDSHAWWTWPAVILPAALIGLALTTRVWNARPTKSTDDAH